VRALAERGAPAVGVDSAEGAQALARHACAVDVLVEIDSAHHRTGVEPSAAGELAVAAERAGPRVRGVFTFPGHGNGPGVAPTAAADELAALERAAADVRGAGVPIVVLSGGPPPPRP